MITTIKVTGADGVERAFHSFDKDVHLLLEKDVDTALENVLTRARARVPKRSGELASTLRKERESGSLVGFVRAGYGTVKRRANSPSKRRHTKNQKEKGIYAPIVEFGSKDPANPRRPSPFLFPAYRMERSSFSERVAKTLADAASKAMSGNSGAVSS